MVLCLIKIHITEKRWFITTEKLQHELIVTQGRYYHEDGTFDGYKKYYYDANNNLVIEEVGYNFTNVVDLINKAEDKACLD